MEIKKVYSSLAEDIVFSGTEEECRDYKKKYETIDNTLYII